MLKVGFPSFKVESKNPGAEMAPGRGQGRQRDSEPCLFLFSMVLGWLESSVSLGLGFIICEMLLIMVPAS